MRQQKSIRDKCNAAGVYFIIASCFFIPFSSSLMGATAALACVCWLLSGKAFSLPRLMLSDKTVFLAILLFLLLVAGIFYSPVDMGGALSNLKKYRELLFFAMVIGLIRDNDKAARFAENGFVSGCVLLLTISYAMYFSILPMEKYGYSTVYHITHSFFMAVLAFWCLQRAFDSRQYIYLWLLLFVAASVNLFYIAPGRTGMLVYVTLILLTLFQRFSLRNSILATLLACLLIGLAFSTSSNFSSRVREAVTEIQNYQSESSRTSLGMRFDWWQNSVDLIRQKPVFGHGTGSFEAVQAELIKDTKTKPTDNPHNEYLLIGVQTGLLGLIVYIGFLGTLFFYSFRLQPPRKYLLQGVVVSMVCGCLMNSFLFDSHPGHYFAIISAILCTTATKNSSLV
jgi:O-antigen ligase